MTSKHINNLYPVKKTNTIKRLFIYIGDTDLGYVSVIT